MSDLQWGAAVGGWRLSGSLDKAEFKVGEPVPLNLVLENSSDTPLTFGAQNPDFDYFLKCNNERGEDVPLTLYGQRMKANRGLGKYIVAELGPKEQRAQELSLTRHLDLTLPGSYTVTVTREVFPARNRGEPAVVSNKCVFEIKE